MLLGFEFSLVPTMNLIHKENVVLLSSHILIWAFIMPLAMLGGLLPYGRHAKTKKSFWALSAKLAWFFQECPAFFIPLYFLSRIHSSSWTSPGAILLLMFSAHYANRTVIYSLKITGGKPTPFLFFFLATLFCAANGYMQAIYHLHIASYPLSWLTSWNFILGTLIFIFGLYTNIRCDNILRNLRKPGETGYKIPRGWMFEYVSGGNYFGEVVEWMGWALACWSAPAFAFAFFSLTFISARSYLNHQWYLQHFKDYPKSRKIIFPFIF